MFFTPPQPSIRAGRRRRWTLAVVLWAFGLATTTLLVGLWGRTVAADGTALTESVRAALAADDVTDRLHGWLRDGFGSLVDAMAGDVDDGLLLVAQSPEADAAMAGIVSEFVSAALAPPGAEAVIDVGDSLAPLVPVVVAELAARGVDVPADAAVAAIGEAAAIVLDTGESLGVSGSAYRARSALTLVFVAGTVALMILGTLALVLAENRLNMLRSLAIRLAVSAGTFVLFLRIGAWAVDPAGGRSPLAAGGAVLLRSNHLVLLTVIGAASAVAAVAGLSIRQRRPSLPLASFEPDDTTELELVPV
mgnify:CR=1 FL=1